MVGPGSSFAVPGPEALGGWSAEPILHSIPSASLRGPHPFPFSSDTTGTTGTRLAGRRRPTQSFATDASRTRGPAIVSTVAATRRLSPRSILLLDAPLRAIPARTGAHEVDERRLQLERGSQRAVIRLIDRPSQIGVDEAVGRLLVVIRRAVRRVDAERSGAALGGCSVDPLLVVEERHTAATEPKPCVEPARVWHLRPMLRAKHVERSEAGRAQIVVPHATIVMDYDP